MARPAKLSESLIQDICLLVAAGVTISDACVSKGISRSTLYLWMERGRRGEDEYMRAAEALYEAQSKARAGVTLNIMRASREDWRAGAWWLERRDPVYSPKGVATRQELMQALIDNVQPLMPVQSFEDLLDALGRLAAGDSGMAERQAEQAPIGTVDESRRLDSGDDPD